MTSPYSKQIFFLIVILNCVYFRTLLFIKYHRINMFHIAPSLRDPISSFHPSTPDQSIRT